MSKRTCLARVLAAPAAPTLHLLLHHAGGILEFFSTWCSCQPQLASFANQLPNVYLATLLAHLLPSCLDGLYGKFFKPGQGIQRSPKLDYLSLWYTPSILKYKGSIFILSQTILNLTKLIPCRTLNQLNWIHYEIYFMSKFYQWSSNLS